MCLGVPMEVVEVRGELGVARLGETTLQVSLALLEDVKPGDWVIVHTGFAIEKLSPDEAMETLRLLSEALGDGE